MQEITQDGATEETLHFLLNRSVGRCTCTLYTEAVVLKAATGATPGLKHLLHAFSNSLLLTFVCFQLFCPMKGKYSSKQNFTSKETTFGELVVNVLLSEFCPNASFRFSTKQIFLQIIIQISATDNFQQTTKSSRTDDIVYTSGLTGLATKMRKLLARNATWGQFYARQLLPGKRGLPHVLPQLKRIRESLIFNL